VPACRSVHAPANVSFRNDHQQHGDGGGDPRPHSPGHEPRNALDPRGQSCRVPVLDLEKGIARVRLQIPPVQQPRGKRQRIERRGKKEGQQARGQVLAPPHGQ